jgi:hypothetical protein
MIDNKVAIDQINAKTQGSLEVAKASAAARGTGTSGNGSTKSASSSKSKAVSTNNRPTNQHGTTSAKIKESLDEDENLEVEITESLQVEEKSTTKVKNHKKIFDSVYKKYENLRNDITETETDLNMLLPLAKDSIMSDIKAQIQMKSFEGMQKAIQDINSKSDSYYLLPSSSLSLEQFYEEADETLKGILKDIEKRIKSNREDKVLIKSVFMALEYRIRFLLEFIMPKVFWYSYVKTGAYYGINKAYIVFNGSDDKDEHPSEINTNAFSIDDIPAYHSFCDCKVSFKVGDND